MTRAFLSLLAGLAQCQPTPPPQAREVHDAPLPPSAEAPAPPPDPVPELYRALSAKRHHALVRVRATPVCVGLDFETLAQQGSGAHGELFLTGRSGAWKLEFELTRATLALKHASTQLPPQGVEVATCRDQLVLGGTPARPTLNGAPLFEDFEACNQALGRDPALNEAPIGPVTGWEIDCIPHAAANVSRPEQSPP